jgi:hypothetical protein
MPHSPGPWTTDEVWVREVATDNMVADCMGDDSIDAATARANARLVAAAPDLLEACRGMVWLYDEGWNERRLKEYIAVCRAAVAKMEGHADGQG